MKLMDLYHEQFGDIHCGEGMLEIENGHNNWTNNPPPQGCSYYYHQIT
jgi:hypothetical protein